MYFSKPDTPLLVDTTPVVPTGEPYHVRPELNCVDPISSLRDFRNCSARYQLPIRDR